MNRIGEFLTTGERARVLRKGTSASERLEERHDVEDLIERKLELRHQWVNPLGQRPLQIRNRILEA